ncbi:hypothetical protein V496_04621 [Pseudogymnoascus sp. VKM F-4515 (FW-2607)]|nr:hypothetical protein V496_04621 [Pseudogymnoascus sp. VKM F-4515 (FW-2607)]KFY96058.1 hypothetical protein V498_02947 [Pseudogymnoascus sp. VKM F-4517 (FW-2822)]
MKLSTTVLAVALLARQASAHYIFQYLTYGGTKFAQYEYIRKNTNYNSPVTDLASNDLRCNVGGSVGAGSTLSVTAGSSITFTADVAVYHQGPVSFYMAKASSTADSFDGAGNVWFKIKDIGPTFSNGAATWNLGLSYSVTIPASVPNGEYLLRIQQLGIHNPWPAGIPQFYIECAQISVTGGGSGVPGPLVAIPGAFHDTDSGYTANIYNSLTSYTVPGPAVWAGGNSGGGGSNTQPPTNPTTTPPTQQTTTAPPTQQTTPPVSGTGAALYGQCGGTGWTGPTTCASGTCKATNQWYSQCLP